MDSQLGPGIDGDKEGESSGAQYVSLSSDGSTVAIRVPYSGDVKSNYYYRGHVRVYSLILLMNNGLSLIKTLSVNHTGLVLVSNSQAMVALFL